MPIRVIPAATLALTLLAAESTSAAAPDLPTAGELFTRHLEAIGGRKAASAIRTVTVRGQMETGGRSSDFTLQVRAPGLVLLQTTDAAGKAVREGRDARALFWRQDAQGTRDLEAARAGELMELVLALFPPGQAGLSERLADAVCEADVVDGRPVVALGRKSARGQFPRLAFDADRSELAAIGETRLEDYRAAGAVRQPHRLRWGADTTVRVAEIRHNDDQPETRFQRPGQGGWLASLLPEAMLTPQLQTKLSAAGRLEIVRQPAVARIGQGRLRQLPAFDAASGRHGQVDLRGGDLSGLDVRQRPEDLLHADFDTNTRWPAALPAEFDPDRIQALGKDPGLGVRELHRAGITGRGVGIGVIDQALLVNHAEYADRLRLYEEIHSPAGAAAQMHGPAVASIAVGRTSGVAPEAELYYIAEQHGNFARGHFEWDFAPLAQSIHRLLDVNASLPADRKLRVISISVGWAPGQQGFEETMTAVERATRERVFVVSTALRLTHRLAFDGLDRPALADPSVASSYRPGSWWASLFWSGQMRFRPGERLCVPMDSRTLASPTGPDDYVHYASSGWSWVVPWLAGLYALACQADQEITPERFWAEALATGRTITVEHDGEKAELGTIANPVALIERLRSVRQDRAAVTSPRPAAPGSPR